MKKIFIILISILILQSCGNQTESLLIGKWETDTKSVEKELENTNKEDLKDAIAGLMNSGLKNMLEFNVEFKADKTVELKLMGQSMVGKWELIEEGDIKEIKIDGKLPQTIRIKSITKDKLVLTGFSIKGINLNNKELTLISVE